MFCNFYKNYNKCSFKCVSCVKGTEFNLSKRSSSLLQREVQHLNIGPLLNVKFFSIKNYKDGIISEAKCQNC